jgi:hypothetical protein
MAEFKTVLKKDDFGCSIKYVSTENTERQIMETGKPEEMWFRNGL